MCPPAFCLPADMILNGADEQVIMFLDGLRNGNPLPNNVIEDINPYQYNPSNLPGGFWYLVRSTGKKETEFGFWREKEGASEIFPSSNISGQRTTLEFIEFQDTQEQITNWVMQEYKITEKGQCDTNKEKESRVICRVFLSEGQSSSTEMHPNSREAVIGCRNQIPSGASVVQSTDRTSKQSSKSVSLVNDGADGKNVLFDADSLLNPRIRDITELHYIYDGDYLELDDLADKQSHSTSSNDSSRSSSTLDEYFDPYALLQEMENDNRGQQEKDSNSKFNVAASVRPCEVVMHPATLGSLVCASGRRKPVGCTTPSSILKTQTVLDYTVKEPKADKRDEDSSSSLGVATSLKSGISKSKGKEKAVGVRMKGITKYFCFMSF